MDYYNHHFLWVTKERETKDTKIVIEIIDNNLNLKEEEDLNQDLNQINTVEKIDIILITMKEIMITRAETTGKIEIVEIIEKIDIIADTLDHAQKTEKMINSLETKINNKR